MLHDVGLEYVCAASDSSSDNENGILCWWETDDISERDEYSVLHLLIKDVVVGKK